MSRLKMYYTLTPKLTVNQQDYDLVPLLQLLDEIDKEGNLRIAARVCGFSYRKAWDILKQFESLFGLKLVDKHRGKGSKLSHLGQKLLAINGKNRRMLNENLIEAANQSNTFLDDMFSLSKKLRIVASDSEKLNQLHQYHLPIELHIDGSAPALAAYVEGKCEIAGFHLANNEQFVEYNQYLDQVNDRFILLEQRQQGIISHPEKPVQSLQQIIEKQLIFVNRQIGSGTRFLIDSLLNQQNISPEQIHGYYHEEHTHLAVACMIISRQADAGLGTEGVAKQLNLDFFPITSENYFLVFKQLNSQVQQVLNALKLENNSTILDYNGFVNWNK